MHHAVVGVIMSQCLAALGVDTFYPGTVLVRCIWWLLGVTVLTCVRAFKRAYGQSMVKSVMLSWWLLYLVWQWL